MPALSILYVEDNDDLRATVAELMEGDGRQVLALPNAEQALAAWAAQPFDVLMTDISLPGISGTELARRVLADRPRQWVVFCSGYAEVPALTRLGPNVRAIPKAFDIDQLDALMAEIDQALAALRPP